MLHAFINFSQTFLCKFLYIHLNFFFFPSPPLSLPSFNFLVPTYLQRTYLFPIRVFYCALSFSHKTNHAVISVNIMVSRYIDSNLSLFVAEHYIYYIKNNIDSITLYINTTFSLPIQLLKGMYLAIMGWTAISMSVHVSL